MISSIEFFMYRISDLLLAPMLLAILFVFFFGFYSIGQLAVQGWQRKQNRETFQRSSLEKGVAGYELQNFQVLNPQADFDAVEVFAFKRLEFLKLVTKISPMLGLVTTMIPMGPALKSLADGNIQGISENLSIAFAGVIFALVAASLTYVCVSVKKRWLAQDLLIAKERLDAVLVSKPAEFKAVSEELSTEIA